MDNTNFNFYRRLKALSNFHDIMNKDIYQSFPEDWYIVVTDVKGATKAINSGKYKEVNIAGSIPIMAVSNILNDMDFPFIFGGDGVTFFIPEEIISDVKDVLADTRSMVKKNFNIELRVELIRLNDLHKDGYHISVAKLKVSDYYYQASISGNGLEQAEKLIKDESTADKYILDIAHVSQKKANFSGFTCRWQDVHSREDETLALIVKICSQDEKEQMLQLLQIYNKINDIFGSEDKYHPLKNYI